jgi:hypothetical protein
MVEDLAESLSLWIKRTSERIIPCLLIALNRPGPFEGDGESVPAPTAVPAGGEMKASPATLSIRRSQAFGTSVVGVKGQLPGAWMVLSTRTGPDQAADHPRGKDRIPIAPKIGRS